MERLTPDDRNAPLTMEHLESFAKDGLRTLCLAYRVLSNEEYSVSGNGQGSIETCTSIR